MTAKERMILESKAWTLEKQSLDKTYFQRLTSVTDPEIFWLGSIDNLVPVRELISAGPGDITVYRNIAAQIREDDISLMGSLQNAVESFHVKYIIVCGYSHCTGIDNILHRKEQPAHLKKWLEGLQEIFDLNRDKFKGLTLDEKRQLLCELNIKAQITRLSKFEMIQKAWERSDHPILLGWYFDLTTGSLREIFTMEENHRAERVSSVA